MSLSHLYANEVSVLMYQLRLPNFTHCNAHETFIFIKTKRKDSASIVMIDLVTKKHWSESYLKKQLHKFFQGLILSINLWWLPKLIQIFLPDTCVSVRNPKDSQFLSNTYSHFEWTRGFITFRRGKKSKISVIVCTDSPNLRLLYLRTGKIRKGPSFFFDREHSCSGSLT